MQINIQHNGETLKITEFLGLYCRKPYPCGCTLTDRLFEERRQVMLLLHRFDPDTFARVVTDGGDFSLSRLVDETIKGRK